MRNEPKHKKQTFGASDAGVFRFFDLDSSPPWPLDSSGALLLTAVVALDPTTQSEAGGVLGGPANDLVCWEN